MGRFRHGSSRLLPLLLAVAATELLLNRIAVDILRPPPTSRAIEPPLWHQVLDVGALFSYYFASALAICALALAARFLLRDKDRPYPREVAILVGVSAAAFSALAAWAVMVAPGVDVSLAFNLVFVVLLVLTCIAQVTNRGDIRARLGIALFSIPFFIHFSSFLALWLYDGPGWAVARAPETFHRFGQLSMAAAAITAPLFFGPRPLLRHALRIGPATVAALIGLSGGVILQERYDIGIDLASRGLGIQLGPGAPTPLIAVYLIAIATLTWTLVSCFVAHSAGRRQIGIGIGLVITGGYAFAWPLHYLSIIVGLLAIGDGAERAANEEHGARAGFSAPPVADETWQTYAHELATHLGAPAPITSRDGEVAITHIVGQRRDLDFGLRVCRDGGRVQFLELLCGAPPPSAIPPSWTLAARPEGSAKVLAGRHPEPPPVAAGVAATTDDPPFDRRFRVREGRPLTATLLDADLRARTTALVDGWLAFWPPQSLVLRIHPGCGAPLDHPIPISELAFRGEGATPSVERLVTVLDLLLDICARAMADNEAENQASSAASGSSAPDAGGDSSDGDQPSSAASATERTSS